MITELTLYLVTTDPYYKLKP